MVSHIVINHVVKGKIHTIFGTMDLYRFSITDLLQAPSESVEHLAVVKRNGVDWDGPVLCRFNSACITSEVFNCTRCDCKWQLDKAMELISAEGQGIITYHASHEGRGFGLATKLLSYNKMDEGLDTVESYSQLGTGMEDARNYRASIAILNYFNITQVRLIGNNRKKYEATRNAGIQVVDRFALVYDGTDQKVLKYLSNKSKEPEQDLLRDRMKINV
ncbi:GTP cyclohydrolase II [Paenibacillus algorifonticola]|uniref:GTP cyclohydrolase II n=1 Tax=Paenibacillus algorifonticola TaxID=684063 RepID=A0A1I2DKA9_9BACL|nr:hypothetical protein [Paenibacillus algorifonticola]SFE80994.1 GTP cyclohydrolase II [Paenibacillus algorifonticola]